MGCYECVGALCWIGIQLSDEILYAFNSYSETHVEAGTEEDMKNT